MTKDNKDNKDNIDQKIVELLAVVEKQKTEVEKAEKESKKSWKTNCSLKFTFRPEHINLQVATEAVLKQALTDLLIQKEYQEKAEELLGLEVSNEFLSFSFDDWQADCIKRMAVIGIKAKKEKLVKLESRLGAIVSPEQRRQMELDAITKSLED